MMNLPTLYKIRYKAPTFPVFRLFRAYNNNTKAIKKFPALENNWVGISFIPLDAMDEL
jgi:hypothetical protein